LTNLIDELKQQCDCGNFKNAIYFIIDEFKPSGELIEKIKDELNCANPDNVTLHFVKISYDFSSYHFFKIGSSEPLYQLFSISAKNCRGNIDLYENLPKFDKMPIVSQINEMERQINFTGLVISDLKTHLDFHLDKLKNKF
jgi:hypothetical protein